MSFAKIVIKIGCKISVTLTGRGGLVVSVGALMFKHKSVLLHSPGSNPAWGMKDPLSTTTYGEAPHIRHAMAGFTDHP